MERSAPHRIGLRWLLAAALAAGVGVAATASLAASGLLSQHSQGAPLAIEEASPLAEMSSIFSKPPSGPIPADVAELASSFPDGAPPGMPDVPGKVLVDQGRLSLSDLGPKHRAIYVFPTVNSEVCDVITGLAGGCLKGFLVGEPAAIAGGVGYYPPESGPPAELAGLVKDGVTDVKIVVSGRARDVVFGNNAWYYEFPDNHTPMIAASSLLLTLADGSSVTVPIRTVDPSSLGVGSPATQETPGG